MLPGSSCLVFIYLRNVRGLDLKASASYTTLLFLTMAACSPLGGAISDKLTKMYGNASEGAA